MKVPDQNTCRSWPPHVWLQHHSQLLQPRALQHTLQLLHQPGSVPLAPHSLQEKAAVARQYTELRHALMYCTIVDLSHMCSVQWELVFAASECDCQHWLMCASDAPPNHKWQRSTVLKLLATLTTIVMNVAAHSRQPLL